MQRKRISKGLARCSEEENAAKGTTEEENAAKGSKVFRGRECSKGLARCSEERMQ